MKNSAHSTEWCLLQNQFDSYEKHSLYIKVTSLVVFLAAMAAKLPTVIIVFSLAAFWLQDAIWKTFQSRIEARLLQLERSIADSEKSEQMQYNTNYQRTALSGGSLVAEYLTQALRPTVAYPYVILIIGAFIELVLP